MSGLIKTGQAARELGLSRYQVIRMIHAGHLPARRIGHDFFIRPLDVEGFKGSNHAVLQAAYWEVVEPLNTIHVRIVSETAPDVQPRIVTVQASVEALGAISRERDRALCDALRTMQSTAIGMRALFDSYATQVRPGLAQALADRAGREHPTLTDFAVADFFLPFRTAVLAGLAASGFQRRTVDIGRKIAADWGIH
jgi:excisionase family DNA binding protein